MFYMNPITIWIFSILGFICVVGVIAVNVWYKRLIKPTNQQFDLKHRLLQLFYSGILIFLLFPFFIWLMLLPV